MRMKQAHHEELRAVSTVLVFAVVTTTLLTLAARTPVPQARPGRILACGEELWLWSRVLWVHCVT